MGACSLRAGCRRLRVAQQGALVAGGRASPAVLCARIKERPLQVPVCAASGRGPVRIHAVGRLAIWTNQRRAERQLERKPDAPCTRPDRKQQMWLDSNELAPKPMPRCRARAAGDGRLPRTRVLAAGSPRAAAWRAVDGWELCGHGCAGRSAGKVRGGE